MPYPQHGGHNASSIFVNSQRPPAGSHLSAWLHGDSAVVREHLNSKSRPTGKRKATHARSVTAPVQQTGAAFDSYATLPLRPRASTMSVIDPVQSPNPAASRTASTSFYGAPRSRYNSTHPGFAAATVPPLASGALQESAARDERRQNHHRRHRRQQMTAWEKQTKPPPVCFPSITDRKVRLKSIGTLVSGTLLMLALTICKSPLLYYSTFCLCSS